MSPEKKIIRFQPNGPAETDLSVMELDSTDFQSGLPEQHVHIYYEDKELGLSLGVWTTTDMQETFGPYPGDEFMWVLEGQVAMVDGDGNETLIKHGETFCIRNAIPISWKQVGFLRKFYMTYVVEWRGGISPPRSPRTVREPLGSYGSRCSAISMT